MLSNNVSHGLCISLNVYLYFCYLQLKIDVVSGNKNRTYLCGVWLVWIEFKNEFAKTLNKFYEA